MSAGDRGRGWLSAFARAAVVSAAALIGAGAWVACRAPALNNGAACARATECESLICSFQFLQDAGPDGRAMGSCVGRCTMSDNCAAGQVCGRFDFRGIIPDSGGPDAEGVREGPDFEVLRACRPRGTRTCSRDDECNAGEGCLGAPMGVCGARCARSNGCATRLCLAADGHEACNEPGVCVAECDDARECHAGSYCQFAYSNSVHGRCAPIATPDAAVCSTPDAASDASDASDAQASDGAATHDAPPADASAANDGSDGS